MRPLKQKTQSKIILVIVLLSLARCALTASTKLSHQIYFNAMKSDMLMHFPVSFVLRLSAHLPAIKTTKNNEHVAVNGDERKFIHIVEAEKLYHII
jgi:hypothetical protein